MPLLRTIASGLLGRSTAKRVGRLIPNPVLRYAAVTAATALAPIIVNKVADRWRSRRSRRGKPASATA